MRKSALLIITIGVFGVCTHLYGQTTEDTVAVIDGKRLTLAEVDRSIEGKLRPLLQQVYALRKSALDNLIVATLLQKEAARRGMTVEQFRRALAAETFDIPDEQVERTYTENAAAFAAMSPDEAKERMRIDLETRERMRIYREGVARLRDQAQVEVLLQEPGVRVSPAIARGVSRGPDSAQVVVTEFADFECVYCRSAKDTLSRLLTEYDGAVKVVFKHLPLKSHSQAFDAARAAVCAAEQSSFWEYHDELFAANSLSHEQLEAAASKVGLDAKAFADCQAADRSGAAVQADVEEARRLGITGTPTFVINGALLPGAAPLERLQEIVDREIQRGKKNAH